MNHRFSAFFYVFLAWASISLSLILAYQPQENDCIKDHLILEAILSDRQLYECADADYLHFWEERARELTWYKPWEQTLDWKPPYASWFLGGQLNISYNCLDRHLLAGHGEKSALVAIREDGTRRVWSYHRLYEEVNKLSNALKECGVQKGDRVAIYMPMVPEALASMLACARIGAIHTVIFGGISAVSVKERIQDAEVNLLITADGSIRGGKFISYKGAVDTVLSECPSLKRVLVFNNCGCEEPLTSDRDIRYSDIMSRVASYCEPEVLNSEDPSFILYTSGTTGKPKGILHTTAGYLVGTHYTFKTVFDFRHDDVYWCTADIGWITGHSYTVYGPLSNCATQVIYEGALDIPGKNRFAKIIDQEHVSIFYTAPTLVRLLMQWGNACTEGASFDSLRLLGSIGEPINPESWMWFYKNIGQERCPIIDTWFQTETGALVISPLPHSTSLKPGSVYKQLPGYNVDVLDEEGNPTDRGFLAILKPYPSMMRGVYKNHERYVETYWSKWNGKYYFAGDYAMKDNDGYIWVGGRCDEVIKVSGHRIGTAEIENAMLEHSSVAESAVVGVKDALRGSKILCFVVLKNGQDSYPGLEEELSQTVVHQLGAYCRPSRCIIVNGLPKTRSGKILRRVLKNLVEGVPAGNLATLSDPSVMEELAVVCYKLYQEYYASADDRLARISPKPLFRPLPEQALTISAEELRSLVEPILQNHLASTNYDRLYTVEQFLRHYHTLHDRYKVTPLEALVHFNVPYEVESRKGGSCQALAGSLQRALNPHLVSYQVGSTLSKRYRQDGWPIYAHVALVIPFSDPTGGVIKGYALADTNFDIPQLIILSEQDPSIALDLPGKGLWRFVLEGEKIACYTRNGEEPEQLGMTYLLTEYLNAPEVGVKSMIANDQKISLVAREALGQHTAHLNVNYKLQLVTRSMRYQPLEPLTFDEVLLGKQFEKEFLSAFGVSTEQLKESLRYVVENANVLALLRQEYSELLSVASESNRFYPNTRE